MRLPALTAERSIGPTRGTYRATGPATTPGTPAVTPMVLMNQPLRQWTEPGDAVCGANETTCFGKPDSPYWSTYVCCPRGTTCTVNEFGRPDCDADAMTQMIRNTLDLGTATQSSGLQTVN